MPAVALAKVGWILDIRFAAIPHSLFPIPQSLLDLASIISKVESAVRVHAVSLLLLANTPEVAESIGPGHDHSAVDAGPEICSGLGMILLPVSLPAGSRLIVGMD